MEDSEDRIVHRTDLRAREGAIFVYQELPKWLFVAQLETLEVNEWGVKGTVLPLPHVGLSCPPRAFTASGTWSVLSLTEMRWSASYAGWSMRSGDEIVAKLISRASELAHIPLFE